MMNPIEDLNYIKNNINDFVNIIDGVLYKNESWYSITDIFKYLKEIKYILPSKEEINSGKLNIYYHNRDLNITYNLNNLPK